jgi:hypothetical protein
VSASWLNDSVEIKRSDDVEDELEEDWDEEDEWDDEDDWEDEEDDDDDIDDDDLF